jgi:hypothetical protein
MGAPWPPRPPRLRAGRMRSIHGTPQSSSTNATVGILVGVTALVTAGSGFLLAVLWFDLMFDVQVLRRRERGGEVPEEVLASIAS